jgi:hypothetical protein
MLFKLLSLLLLLFALNSYYHTLPANYDKKMLIITDSYNKFSENCTYYDQYNNSPIMSNCFISYVKCSYMHNKFLFNCNDIEVYRHKYKSIVTAYTTKHFQHDTFKYGYINMDLPHNCIIV